MNLKFKKLNNLKDKIKIAKCKELMYPKTGKISANR